MPFDANQPAQLIALALKSYRDEILPALAPGERYRGAMIGNALGIALRDLNADLAGRENELLKRFYGAQARGMSDLARDIRSRRIDAVPMVISWSASATI